jgi:hypothetical protein
MSPLEALVHPLDRPVYGAENIAMGRVWTSTPRRILKISNA